MFSTWHLGLEYDGSTHRDSLAADNGRQNRLQDAGYRLLRFTAADVNRTPDAVVELVARQVGGYHLRARPAGPRVRGS